MILRKTLIWTLGLSFISQLCPFSAVAGESNLSLLVQTADPSLEGKLMKGHHQFSFQIFSQVTQDKPLKNCLISPLSLEIALSLLYNGAEGQTQQEINELLGFQGLTLKEINQHHQQRQQRLENLGKSTQLNIANSLWVKQGVSFRHSFLRNNREYYQAEVTNLDFANPQSVGIINRWVSQKTQGKIRKIIDQIDSDNILFLINGIYFKGSWQSAFNPKLTSSEAFYLENNPSKKHPLMRQEGRFLYYENNDFQAISLPYQNSRLRFYVFLPKEDKSLKTFLAKLNDSNWNQWLSQFNLQEGVLKLPRFRSEWDKELSESLKALGMNTAFLKGKANFSQMTSYPVVVDQVKHSTFIEVNEEGTEAAASTSVGISVTSAGPNQHPFQMIVNRPFFYSIQDQDTGVILFMGIVVNPEQ